MGGLSRDVRLYPDKKVSRCAACGEDKQHTGIMPRLYCVLFAGRELLSHLAKWHVNLFLAHLPLFHDLWLKLDQAL